MKLNVNIQTLVANVTPRVMRKSKFEALLKSATKPFQTINNSLVTFGDEMALRSRYNSQTIVLEKLLNDLFDTTSRRISIETITRSADVRLNNAIEEVPVIMWNSSESQDPIYVFNEGNDFEHDFIVYLPTGVFSTNQKNQISGWVNWLRSAGKRFTIEET